MKTGKAVFFDMDTKEMRKHFRFISVGYWKIRRELRAQGFEHIQGSAYIHKEPMTQYEAFDALRQMIVNQPWMIPCIKDIKLADLGKVYQDTYGKLRGMLSTNRVIRNATVSNQVTAQQQQASASVGQQPTQQRTDFGCSQGLMDMIQHAPSAARQQAPAAAHVSKSENVND